MFVACRARTTLAPCSSNCARVPGLTQARIVELAGYDPAVITRMARGGQDLTGPHARARVLQVIQALDEAGALRDLEDANALLAAANLSPLVEAREHEAGLIRRVLLHSGAHSKPGFASVAETKEPARRLLHEYARIWDRASNDIERVVVLAAGAAAGELAMRHGHSTRGRSKHLHRPWHNRHLAGDSRQRVRMRPSVLR